ncbi:MAG TPA: tetratricopeptide repeat protein [Pirellulaceae bacterium]|nr:tetratricopeptide repeat protein [Pirellulaceae bacterium]
MGGQSAGIYHSGAAPAPTNPITKAWKSTSDSVASVFSPKSATAPTLSPKNDPTSLSSKSKISASTYIATGRLLESREEFVKAQAEYEKAIQVEPKNLTALVSLARLQDRQGNPDQAIVTYQKAIKAHPKSALVHNDLGLCYARKRDLASAVAMLHKAVEAEPSKPNYRNNLATVLVEAGRTDDALKHLQAVHAPAAAHFNLAYLLNHRGQSDLARRHLSQAVQLDPTFVRAQEMLAQLDGGAATVEAAVHGPQISAAGPAATQQNSPALSAAPQGSPYGGIAEPEGAAGYRAQDVPAQSIEPVYHIGSEGIETSPAEGPSLSQPTTFQSSGTQGAGKTLGYHLDDLGEDDVLVVTHLVYGADKDPAPQPGELVDDEALEEARLEAPATEPSHADEPSNVKPVTNVPTLYPIVE